MQLTIAIAERSVDVSPLRVGEIPGFLRVVEPALRDLATGDVTAAWITHADAIIAATALGARVERDWLDAQTADALIKLATAVIEVNVDFFAQRMLPLVTDAAARLTALTPSGGMRSFAG